jgi:hypothetical protein
MLFTIVLFSSVVGVLAWLGLRSSAAKKGGAGASR